LPDAHRAIAARARYGVSIESYGGRGCRDAPSFDDGRSLISSGPDGPRASEASRSPLVAVHAQFSAGLWRAASGASTMPRVTTGTPQPMMR